MPALRWLKQPAPKKLRFVNSVLCQNIEYAFHALALYEHRRPFSPMLWQKAPTPEKRSDEFRQVLKQCWFIGSHENIGGGASGINLAHIPLIWMMAQLKEHDLLTFDEDHLWWDKINSTKQVVWLGTDTDKFEGIMESENVKGSRLYTCEYRPFPCLKTAETLL